MVTSDTVVISSTEGAAKIVGGALGQYEYHEDKGYYVQKSTEQSNENFEATYLYPDEQDFWWVSLTPGQRGGLLRNPLPSKALPSRGWQHVNGESWQDDLTLTVNPGPLPSLPRQFTVTATGAVAEVHPAILGVFTKTQRWWYGRPVYVNTIGQYLYHGPRDLGWKIGPLGYAALIGSRARNSPAKEDSWKYWSGSEWKPASVKVTGSD